jgi:hypothetical protein
LVQEAKGHAERDYVQALFGCPRVEFQKGIPGVIGVKEKRVGTGYAPASAQPQCMPTFDPVKKNRIGTGAAKGQETGDR